MYLVKTPGILKPFSSDLHWGVQTTEKEVFLTFDDGPVPGITEEILDILAAYHARGTFFCVGQNVEKHPRIFRRILDEGHAVGNHTYSHMEGWKNGQYAYLKDYLRCETLVNSSLFRPPYGRIKREQAHAIAHRSDVVMWDVLSADFDTSKTGEDCLRNCLKHCKPGSIVVFHDSLKAQERVLYALPRFLEEFGQRGYSFPALTHEHFLD